MKQIVIKTVPGFDEWKVFAKMALTQKIPPDQILWTIKDTENDLFNSSVQKMIVDTTTVVEPIAVSSTLLSMIETACCYNDPDRFAYFYKVLWRHVYEDKNFFKNAIDKDTIQLNKMMKAVYKDAYKITAFLRFRDLNDNGEEHFIAWYEPEHYTIERVIPFFKTRFKNMKWSILTPYRAIHWDGEEIHLTDNPDPSLYPQNDKIEEYWLGYYANIFNPSRVKKNAMLNQMPKKYWKNMPETVLIDDLLKTAQSRTKKMIEMSSSIHNQKKN